MMSSPSDLSSMTGFTAPSSGSTRRGYDALPQVTPDSRNALRRRLDENVEDVQMQGQYQGVLFDDDNASHVPLVLDDVKDAVIPNPDINLNSLRISDPYWDSYKCWSVIMKAHPGLWTAVTQSVNKDSAVEAAVLNVIAKDIVRRTRYQAAQRKQITNIWSKLRQTSSTAYQAKTRYSKINASKKRQADWINHLRSKAYAFK